jgi:hypothetical protein
VLGAVRRPYLVDPLPRLPDDEPALLALDLEQPPRLLLGPAPLPRSVQRRVRDRPHLGEDRRDRRHEPLSGHRRRQLPVEPDRPGHLPERRPVALLDADRRVHQPVGQDRRHLDGFSRTAQEGW